MTIQQQASGKVVVEPNCRYGHGLLTLLSYGNGHTDWVVTGAHGNTTFHGHMYLCKACGYTEFFDNDIDKTRDELEQLE
jgi:hypothetical protein